MAASPLPSPLVIEMGTDWAWAVTWKTARLSPDGLLQYDDASRPLGDLVDLTGSTVEALMQFRSEADSPVVLLELSSANGGIAIDTVNSKFTAALDAAATAALAWTEAVTDLLVTVDGVPRLLVGETRVKVRKPVTRA